MMFRKPYEVHEGRFSCSGETKRPIYTLVNNHGERSLKHVGDEDIQEKINSYRDVTNIKAMLKRYSLTGDISVLNGGVRGVYEDVRDVETNYAKLIERSRELALLKLQAAAHAQQVSKLQPADGVASGSADGVASGSADGVASGSATE